MSKSCFTLAFSCSNPSKQASFHSDVLHTSCASAGRFSFESTPKAAIPANIFDAKLRRVKSFITVLHFIFTGISPSRIYLCSIDSMSMRGRSSQPYDPTPDYDQPSRSNGNSDIDICDDSSTPAHGAVPLNPIRRASPHREK